VSTRRQGLLKTTNAARPNLVVGSYAEVDSRIGRIAQTAECLLERLGPEWSVFPVIARAPGGSRCRSLQAVTATLCELER